MVSLFMGRRKYMYGQWRHVSMVSVSTADGEGRDDESCGDSKQKPDGKEGPRGGSGKAKGREEEVERPRIRRDIRKVERVAGRLETLVEGLVIVRKADIHGHVYRIHTAVIHGM
jgi:hypothetical protein